MSKYQSINISQEHEALANCEEVTALNAASQQEPDPELDLDAQTMNGETSSLLNFKSAKSDILQKPWLSGYVVLSTLFFGFAVGFSTAFYLCTRTSFAASSSAQSAFMGHNLMDITPTLPAVNESLKERIKTLEKFFLDDIPTSSTSFELRTGGGITQKQQHAPALKLPFQSALRKPLYMTSEESYELLLDSGLNVATISQYSIDFFSIVSGLDAQVNQAYCATATAVAILNSLRFLRVKTVSGSNTKPEDDPFDGVDIPVDSVYSPYPYATQHDIFDECSHQTVISQAGGGQVGVDGILTPPYGLSMEQVGNLLKCHLNSTTDSGATDWVVETRYADKTHLSPGKVKYDIKNALSNPYSRVMVNYDRATVGQAGGGHWSPVGSYSEKRDAFLILDVAKYKYPPAWIPSERLFAAMATYDECGTWNFPDGQDKLSQEERLMGTPEQYASVAEKLGCKKQLRGYIIVTRVA